MARYETDAKKVDSPENKKSLKKSAELNGEANQSSAKNTIPKPKEKPRPSALNSKTDSKPNVQSPKTPIIVSPGKSFQITQEDAAIMSKIRTLPNLFMN